MSDIRGCICSRRSLRRIHQSGSYGSSKMGAGFPRLGRLSNSPASIAARILLSAMIWIARSVNGPLADIEEIHHRGTEDTELRNYIFENSHGAEPDAAKVSARIFSVNSAPPW